mmetsp:Transcript_16877/g.30621  ORF Transcript_16877/g.30621 Transcript_16877/m.30621 type:complete len:125 (-) Transcript_16877:614-988(-)
MLSPSHQNPINNSRSPFVFASTSTPPSSFHARPPAETSTSLRIQLFCRSPTSPARSSLNTVIREARLSSLPSTSAFRLKDISHCLAKHERVRQRPAERDQSQFTEFNFGSRSFNTSQHSPNFCS